ANTVLREIQKGYQFKGRTIRPTSVVVSKMPDEDAPDQENQDDQYKEGHENEKPQD
ncbi:MAG: nucleotide exchange factor GrpE, partial [Planctomycetes bacterium]|nr:nucleotide exchange factor GrpE [Planctomycetota bacterium]